MANTIYCRCGSRTSYAGVKPVDCPSCGEPFLRVVAAKAAPAPAPAAQPARGAARRSSTSRIYVQDAREEDYDDEVAQLRRGIVITSEGNSSQRIVVAGASTNPAFFTRGSDGGGGHLEGMESLDKVKAEAMKHMLNPNPEDR